MLRTYDLYSALKLRFFHFKYKTEVFTTNNTKTLSGYAASFLTWTLANKYHLIERKYSGNLSIQITLFLYLSTPMALLTGHLKPMVASGTVLVAIQTLYYNWSENLELPPGIELGTPKYKTLTLANMPRSSPKQNKPK